MSDIVFSMFRKKNSSFSNNKLLLAEIIQCLQKLESALPKKENIEENKEINLFDFIHGNLKNNENDNSNNNNTDKHEEQNKQPQKLHEDVKKSTLIEICMATNLNQLTNTKLSRMRIIYRLLLSIFGKQKQPQMNPQKLFALKSILMQIGGNIISETEIERMKLFLSTNIAKSSEMNDSKREKNQNNNNVVVLESKRLPFINWAFENSFIFRFPKNE